MVVNDRKKLDFAQQLRLLRPHFYRGYYFNPKRAGIFWRSKSRGGVESTHHGFRAPVYLISLQIIQKWSQMKAGIFIYM